MTQDQTQKKKSPKSTKSAKEPKSSPSGNAHAASEGGYAEVFKHWELQTVDEGFAMVKKPGDLLSIFDVRAVSPKSIDSLIASTKRGIKSPVRVTQMKFTGETGEYPYHVEPGKTVKLKNGEIYTVLTFGRQRTRAGIANGIEVPASMANYTHWSEMVKDAFDENEERNGMDQWDRAATIRNLSESGKTNEEIAAVVSPRVSSGHISHYLAVFTLPEAVQRLFRDGALTPTFIRHMRQLRRDPDLATKIATDCVEKGWTEEVLKTHISAAMAPPVEKETKKNTRKLSRTSFDDFKARPVPQEKARIMLTNVDLYAREGDRKAKLIDKETDPDRYTRAVKAAARLEGIKEGIILALGGEIPAKFLTVVEEAAEE